MHFEEVRLADLVVNRANDRHGELENETAAIAELFRLREQHMRALAADIAAEGRIYDPPLVAQEEGRFTVYDGNRRITCLKLIIEPRRAHRAKNSSSFSLIFMTSGKANFRRRFYAKLSMIAR